MSPARDAVDADAKWSAIEQATRGLHIGIVVTVEENGAARALFANDAYLDLLGYTRAELLALPPGALVSDRERARLRAAYGSQPGAPLPSAMRIEMALRRKDGSEVLVEVGAGPAMWDGRPAFVSFVRDLSERNLALERLVNLETIYNATIDGFLFVDHESEIVSVNRRFAEMFGFTLAELEALPSDVIRDRARACYRDPSQFDAALGVYAPQQLLSTLDGEIELVRPEFRIVHEHSEPILDATGGYLGRVWTFRDVTQERSLAREVAERTAELARHAENLESEVARRGAELAQAEKMAALGRLVAGVAHEVNNPLAFVKSNSEMIREMLDEALADPDPDRVRAFTADLSRLLDSNLRGLVRIERIVDELRTFAAPQRMQKSAVDIDAVLSDAAQMFAARFSDRIALEQDLSAGVKLLCDPHRIAQVVTNLLVNAAQAIPEKGHVKLASRVDGSHVVITVEDDGVGIPREDLARIFEPFFTTKPHGSTGLGLSISYGMVKEHGGVIRVASRPGRGTTFSVHLPLEATN